MNKKQLLNNNFNNTPEISNWFIVEIIVPMSTKFKKDMCAWCKFDNNRQDFTLRTIADDYEQRFGFAYKPHFKKIV